MVTDILVDGLYSPDTPVPLPSGLGAVSLGVSARCTGIWRWLSIHQWMVYTALTHLSPCPLFLGLPLLPFFISGSFSGNRDDSLNSKRKPWTCQCLDGWAALNWKVRLG